MKGQHAHHCMYGAVRRSNLELQGGSHVRICCMHDFDAIRIVIC